MDLELVTVSDELYYSPKYGFVITKEALDAMTQEELQRLINQAEVDNGTQG